MCLKRTASFASSRQLSPPREGSRLYQGLSSGVRENGGQYTHAATWVVLALAEMGRGDDAWKAFQLLNPVNHALSKGDADRYRVEPYVVAADVYGAGDLTGRGGWTWYTGSAGWLYRAAVEGILGLRRQGNRLFVRPALPSEWTGFEARSRLMARALPSRWRRLPVPARQAFR